ncbi:MAG: hypothetical protein R3C16_00995 [Hyphomonadaceae bacterium]
MAQPVTAILSRQSELAARARKFTGDTNEAGLLVHQVVLRAFNKYRDQDALDGESDLSRALGKDLDALIERLRKHRLSS